MNELKDRLKEIARQLRAQAALTARTAGWEVALTPELVNAAASTVAVAELADGESWRAGVRARAGQKALFGGKTYVAILEHITQDSWTPEAAAALWKEEREAFSPWVQPMGSHDAYASGDRVSHLNKRWESLVDANVWEPGVYGWKEIQ